MLRPSSQHQGKYWLTSILRRRAMAGSEVVGVVIDGDVPAEVPVIGSDRTLKAHHSGAIGPLKRVKPYGKAYETPNVR